MFFKILSEDIEDKQINVICADGTDSSNIAVTFEIDKEIKEGDISRSQVYEYTLYNFLSF